MHKGTLKKAQKLGVKMTENTKDQTVTVSWKKYRFVLPFTATAALNEMADVIKFASKSEYRSLHITLEDRDFVIKTKDDQELSKGSTVREAITNLPDVDYGDVADAEDDAEREWPSLSALQAAKPVYKERGDINNCGDWLANQLKDAFLTTQMTDEGKIQSFDIDGFTGCLTANGVPIKEGRSFLPFARRKTRGWQGRYRMNGRQKLEVMVAEKGFLKIDGKKVSVPHAALTELRMKHIQ